MDKAFIGGFLIGASVAYLFGSFVLMSLLNTDFKTQILFGMLPGIIITLIGVGFIIIQYIQEKPKEKSVSHE